MTAAEHSVLVYLINAIEVAPDKVLDLLFLAYRKEASVEFKNILLRLRDAAENKRDPGLLFVKTEEIRNELKK